MAEQVTPPVDPAADEPKAPATDQATSAPAGASSTNGSADPAAPDTNPDSAPSTEGSPSAPAPAADKVGADAPAQPTTPSQGSESVPGATEATAPKKAAARKPSNAAKSSNPKAAAVPPEASTTPQEQATVGPLPHGVVPDQVQINQSLAQILNDLEAFKVRAARLLSGYDYAKLIGHVETAQDWVADRLGLKKADNGGYVNPDQATSQPTPEEAGTAA